MLVLATSPTVAKGSVYPQTRNIMQLDGATKQRNQLSKTNERVCPYMIVQAVLLSSTLGAAHANTSAVCIFNSVVPDNVVIPAAVDTWRHNIKYKYKCVLHNFCRTAVLAWFLPQSYSTNNRFLFQNIKCPTFCGSCRQVKCRNATTFISIAQIIQPLYWIASAFGGLELLGSSVWTLQ